MSELRLELLLGNEQAVLPGSLAELPGRTIPLWLLDGVHDVTITRVTMDEPGRIVLEAQSADRLRQFESSEYTFLGWHVEAIEVDGVPAPSRSR